MRLICRWQNITLYGNSFRIAGPQITIGCACNRVIFFCRFFRAEAIRMPDIAWTASAPGDCRFPPRDSWRGSIARIDPGTRRSSAPIRIAAQYPEI
jgi:hypothetical protein